MNELKIITIAGREYIFEPVPMRRMPSKDPTTWLKFQKMHVPGTSLSDSESNQKPASAIFFSSIGFSFASVSGRAGTGWDTGFPAFPSNAILYQVANASRKTLEQPKKRG